MLINSDHTRWMMGSGAVLAGATAGYVYYAASSPSGPSGGSWPGLAFGVVGTAFMVMAALLSFRKRFLLWRMGSAQVWMKMHIWLGVLAVPFILFHSAFAWGGPLTVTVMILFYIVTASGLFGLALQQFLPAMMTARVPLETVRSQIEHVAAGMAVDAYELVASIAGALPEAAEEQAALAAEEALQKARPGDWKLVRRLPVAESPQAGADALRAFYLSDVRPYLRRAGDKGSRAPDFTTILLEAPAGWRPQLAWLHGWLLLHAPLSFALFVLVAVHVFYALHY
jgi:hypothetical protein